MLGAAEGTGRGDAARSYCRRRGCPALLPPSSRRHDPGRGDLDRSVGQSPIYWHTKRADLTAGLQSDSSFLGIDRRLAADFRKRLSVPPASPPRMPVPPPARWTIRVPAPRSCGFRHPVSHDPQSYKRRPFRKVHCLQPQTYLFLRLSKYNMWYEMFGLLPI